MIKSATNGITRVAYFPLHIKCNKRMLSQEEHILDSKVETGGVRRRTPNQNG